MPKEKKPSIDFRPIRARITMEQVLDHHGVLDTLKGSWGASVAPTRFIAALIPRSSVLIPIGPCCSLSATRTWPVETWNSSHFQAGCRNGAFPCSSESSNLPLFSNCCYPWQCESRVSCKLKGPLRGNREVLGMRDAHQQAIVEYELGKGL